MNEDLKRKIRESLVFAVCFSLPGKTERRLVISEFFHSLNRKQLLYNSETEGEISQAYVQLEKVAILKPWRNAKRKKRGGGEANG